jgi:DNA primase
LPSWDGLIKYLVRKKKYDIKILEQAGLVIERNGKYYDRFRGRIMFPLTDHRGRIVGFSGRVLEADVKEAKYINTPETLLYHKSKMLFGFSQHYQSIREAKQVVVVEGEFDVISSGQAHVSNIVAIKGSALTKEHVELLRRTIDTIILSLDADSAGIQATKRAIQIIQQFDDMRLRVLPSYLFNGKDPDDLARENPHEWREATKQSISVYQFLIDVAFKQNDQSSGEGKQKIVNEVGPVLNMILHAVEKQHYVSLFAKRLGVPESVLQQDLLRLRTGRELSKEKDETQEKKVVDPVTQIEQSVLSTVLQLPENEVIPASKELHPGEFTIPAHRIIIAALQQATVFHLSQFVKTLAPEVAEAASNLYFANIKEQPSALKEFHETVQRFKTFQTQWKMKELSDQLKQLELKAELTPEEEAQMNELLGEIVALRGKG